MTPDQLMGLLLGHLVGDYLLQNEWMTRNKSRRGRWMPGLVHAVVYTFSVMLLMWDWRSSWAIVVFLSHWPVDRYSWAERWLKWIGGRTLDGFLRQGHFDIELAKMAVTEGQISGHGLPITENYRILRGGFHSLVYAVTDNTIHLLLMWGGWHLLNWSAR